MDEGQSEAARRAAVIERVLREAYPEIPSFLRFRTPFELLVGVVLSAQSTDAQVNRILPGLMNRWPHPRDWARADLAELERAIHSTGFFRTKARNLQRAATLLCERHGGEVPLDMDALLALPGVGRKSAHVLRGALGGLPAVIVDTHFGRVVRRLGLTMAQDPARVERDIFALLPPERTYGFSMRVNLHGRQVCRARRPACEACVLRDRCAFFRSSRQVPSPA